MKRQDYLDWDTTLMGIAQIISFRSKDPNTRHGAVIVDQDHKILSLGYNGFPRVVSDDIFPWTSPEKYPYVVHAELNAILNASKDLRNSILYLWSEKGYLPCEERTKAILQSGIKEVVLAFQTIENTKKFDWKPPREMFAAANIRLRVLENYVGSIVLITEQFNKLLENNTTRRIENAKENVCQCGCCDTDTL